MVTRLLPRFDRDRCTLILLTTDCDRARRRGSLAADGLPFCAEKGRADDLAVVMTDRLRAGSRTVDAAHLPPRAAACSGRNLRPPRLLSPSRRHLSTDRSSPSAVSIGSTRRVVR